MKKLTSAEISTAAELLSRAQAIPHMPEELFNVFVSKAVHTIVELITINNEGKILLTWRDDKYYHGWHIPGGFMGVGETAMQAADRIARREIGVKVKKLSFVGNFNYRDLDPRSHSFSIVHTCSSEHAPKNGRYFSIAEMKKLPKRNLLYHVPLLLKVAKLWR